MGRWEVTVDFFVFEVARHFLTVGGCSQGSLVACLSRSKNVYLVHDFSWPIPGRPEGGLSCAFRGRCTDLVVGRFRERLRFREKSRGIWQTVGKNALAAKRACGLRATGTARQLAS